MFRGGNDKLLTSSNGWDDADFVAIFDRGGFVLLEANVFVVNEDIHESADIALLITDAFDEAGMGCIQGRENFANVGPLNGDYFLFVGELAQWRRDSDLCWHKFLGLGFSFQGGEGIKIASPPRARPCHWQ